MGQNQDLCIEIKGHINGRGDVLSGSFHTDLSKARALIVYEKLRLAGINENRMLAKGYGDTQMIYSEPKSEKERRANRRVKIDIVDCNTVAEGTNDSIRDPK